MVYTRKGDDGTSGLLGVTERISKDSPIYEALGTVDELNSLLGMCRAYATKRVTGVDRVVERMQECLFIIQAELAGTDKTITNEHITELEDSIGFFGDACDMPHAFVVPGATIPSSLFDYARTVARRAERRVIAVRSIRGVSDNTRAYLNRLSSVLYVLARHSAMQDGQRETTPSY